MRRTIIAHPSFPPLLYGNATIRFCDDGGGTTAPRLLSLSDVIFVTLQVTSHQWPSRQALKNLVKIGVFVFKVLFYFKKKLFLILKI
jgi:hypothetical protein